MKMLQSAIQKLDEDCKKRRREHLKAFFEKYEQNVGDSDEEVVDFRTLQVTKNKGKRRKKLNESLKNQRSEQNKVIKFGQLNSYSISLKSKKYARLIRKCLRKHNEDPTLDREMDEDESIGAANVLKTKRKNRIDKTDNHVKGDLSEDRSKSNESQNETLPLKSTYNPYFSQFGLHYPANAKLDSLTCDQGPKGRRIKFSTIKRKTKNPVSELNEISPYNQDFWYNPKLDVVLKDLSKCSLADKKATPEIFLKSSRAKFVDSGSRQPLSKISYDDEYPIIKITDPVNEDSLSEPTKEDMPKILSPSIMKSLSTKKKFASKNFNHNSEILNNKLAETLLIEKTRDKGDGNVSNTTKSKKSLYDLSNFSDTNSHKCSTPISGVTLFSIPYNNELQGTAGNIPSMMNNTFPNKAVPRTASAEIFDESSESEISDNSLTSKSSATNSSPVKPRKCYVKLQWITLPKYAPAGSFRSPESRCDFTPSQNIAASPRFIFTKESIPANSNSEGVQKLSRNKSNHNKALLVNKTPAAILKRLRPRCPNSGSTTLKLCSFNKCSEQVDKNAKNYCEGKSQINPNITEIETSKKLPSKDIYKLQRKKQLKRRKILTSNTCRAKKLDHQIKTSGACLTEKSSSDVEETYGCASLPMIKHLSISTQSMSQHSSDEQFISKNRNTTAVECDWKNVSQENSNTNMLEKSNIPSKTNVPLLKKSDAENFNQYVNPSIRTSKNLSTEKPSDKSPPKINNSTVTLISGKSLGRSSSCVTVKDNSGDELPTHISKDAASNNKDKLQNISYSSTEVSKTLSSNIICTPTLKKYSKRNILDSSASEILDYLNKTSDTEVSTGTSSDEDDITNPDRSASVSSHLPSSNLGVVQFTCHEPLRDRNAPSVLSDRENKLQETSNTIVLKKTNIPPKKNIFLLKKSNTENLNHDHVNPRSRTSKTLSEKSGNRSLSKINSPIVTLNSGRSLGRSSSSSCVTVKDKSANEPHTHTSKDATSNNKDKLQNIACSASTQVSKTFPSNSIYTPYIAKKCPSRKMFPSNLFKIYDFVSEASDTEVSDDASIGKPSTEDDIPNLDRSSSVARCLSLSSCGRTQNSGGRQLGPNSNVPSRVCDSENKSEETSAAVVLEKSNILPSNISLLEKSATIGYIKPGNEISGKLLTGKSSSIKDCPKMSTSYSIRSRKDYSIASSVTVTNCSGGGHPVTRSKNRISYSKDNFKKLSSNNVPCIGENSLNQDVSTPEIIKKRPRCRKVSAPNTCPAPENVKKRLRNRKMSATNIISPCGKSGNSSKTIPLTTPLVKKHCRSRKTFARNTHPAKTIDKHLPPSVEVPNKQNMACTYNFKAFSDFAKSWHLKQSRSLENSQNCSSDGHPLIDRVLRNESTGSVRYCEDELLNTSYIPPEGFLAPLSKRLKFPTNIPVDCLSPY